MRVLNYNVDATPPLYEIDSGASYLCFFPAHPCYSCTFAGVKKAGVKKKKELGEKALENHLSLLPLLKIAGNFLRGSTSRHKIHFVELENRIEIQFRCLANLYHT